MGKNIVLRGNCNFSESSTGRSHYGDMGLLENVDIVQDSVNFPTNYGNTVMTLTNSNNIINPSTSSVTYKQLVVNTTGGQLDVDINSGTIISVLPNSGITLCWLKPLSEWIQVH